MFEKIDEISLLVFVFKRLDIENIRKILCKYTGCSAEVYTENVILEIYEKAISDISRKYHVPSLFYYYFFAKHREEMYNAISKPEKRSNSELEAIIGALMEISLSVFDEKDIDKMKELRKEYGEKEN